MALPSAAQRGRNPAHGALAGDRSGGADQRGVVCSLDGASARVCAFTLAVLAADRISGACRGGDAAGSLPATVDESLSSGGARGGYRLAGAHCYLCDRAAGTVFSVLRVCHGSGRLSLGNVGDGWDGGGGGGASGDRSLRGAKRTGAGGGSMAAGLALGAAGSQRARTGSAAAVHEFGIPGRTRVLAGLYGGEPEEDPCRARGDYSGSEFDPSRSGTDRNHAADSWGSDEHLRRAPGAERLAGSAQLPRVFSRGE